MSLPGVTITVTNGNLGIAGANPENAVIYAGCCTGGTPDTLAFYGDLTAMENSLSRGEVLEAAAYGLQIGAKQVGVLVLPPTTAGAFSSVTQVGGGAMTMSVSAAPDQAITITCTTGGTITNAAFTIALGSGAASAAVVIPATAYLIPGTYCYITLTAGTYTTSDVYTISVLGAVTHTAGAGPAVPTFTCSPVDQYTPTITVTTAGALATSAFTYSLDGTAGNTSAPIRTTGGGTYAIPNTGIVLTFSGTAVAGDTYSFKCVPPTYTDGDLATALALLSTTYLSAVFSMVVPIGNLLTSAAWVTQTSTLVTAALALFAKGVYVRMLDGVPTVGSLAASGSSVVVNSASTDAAITTSRLSVSTSRVATAAGDGLLTSVITGLSQRRNGVWFAAARAILVSAAQNIGAVEDGSLPGVTFIYRNEEATPGLDALGFITLRTFAGSVSTGTGLPGFFLTNGHTMDVVTSDYYPLANARVIDKACAVARAGAMPLINSKVPTTTRNGNVGVITEARALQIETALNNRLETAMVNTEPQDAVLTAVVVNRTHNIIADSTLIIGISVQPYSYASFISEFIGLSATIA